ncbi:hypothetical protein GCM10009679_57400 [Saccharothrix algeriensis]
MLSDSSHMGSALGASRVIARSRAVNLMRSMSPSPPAGAVRVANIFAGQAYVDARASPPWALATVCRGPFQLTSLLTQAEMTVFTSADHALPRPFRRFHRDHPVAGRDLFSSGVKEVYGRGPALSQSPVTDENFPGLRTHDGSRRRPVHLSTGGDGAGRVRPAPSRYRPALTARRPAAH